MRIVIMLVLLAAVWGIYNGIDALSGGVLRHNDVLSIVVIIVGFVACLLISKAISNFGKKK